MPDTSDAVLEDNEGRSLLRFERVLQYPPERVWRALTEPAALAAWHPTPCEFEPVAGGVARYIAAGPGPEMPAGEIIEYDPPRVLAHTWGEDRLRWELHPHEGGCLLVLTHTFADHFKAARDAAGWHLCLDTLAASLAGIPTDLEAVGEQTPSAWRELNSAYEERFGIPADQATPPPPR